MKTVSRFTTLYALLFCILGWVYLIFLSEGDFSWAERNTNTLIFIGCQVIGLICAGFGFPHINNLQKSGKQTALFVLWALIVAVAILSLFMGANLLFLNMYGI